MLWYEYDVARRAAAQSLALQTQLGQTPPDYQIAAALGLSAPFSLSQCLAAGKVHILLSLLPDKSIFKDLQTSVLPPKLLCEGACEASGA